MAVQFDLTPTLLQKGEIESTYRKNDKFRDSRMDRNRRSIKTCQLLIATQKTNHEDYDQHVHLLRSAYHNDAPMVRYLIQVCGIDPEKTISAQEIESLTGENKGLFREGESAFTVAIRRKNQAIIDIFHHEFGLPLPKPCVPPPPPPPPPPAPLCPPLTFSALPPPLCLSIDSMSPLREDPSSPAPPRPSGLVPSLSSPLPSSPLPSSPSPLPSSPSPSPSPPPHPSSPLSPSLSHSAPPPAASPSPKQPSPCSSPPLSVPEYRAISKRPDFGEILNTFAKNPTKAIKELIQDSCLAEDPLEVAHFIISCEELDKTAIGEYLGERDDFHIDVLAHCVRLLDFSNLSFVRSLRRLLSRFRLPGESQKIERITEVFADVYFEVAEPGLFAHPDTIFVLSYSTIMLNTDAHNPQVKKKMTLEQFVANNRGINQGSDLPLSLLQSIYEDIQQQSIRLKDDDPYPDAVHKAYLELHFVKNSKKQVGKKKRRRMWVVLTKPIQLMFHLFHNQQDEGKQPVASKGMGCIILDVSRSSSTKVKFSLLEAVVGKSGVAKPAEGGWILRCLASRPSFGVWVTILKQHTNIHFTAPSRFAKTDHPPNCSSTDSKLSASFPSYNTLPSRKAPTSLLRTPSPHRQRRDSQKTKTDAK